MDRVKKTFPIPKEHYILWADCEFERKCSGIICTNFGCFIKTDTIWYKELINKNEKSRLYYFKWDNFDPSFFIKENENNPLKLVNPSCQTVFYNKCLEFSKKLLDKYNKIIDFDLREFDNYLGIILGTSTGVNIGADDTVEQTGKYSNNKVGHGLFAEEANNIYDIMHGKNAEILGRNNAENGPDRVIHRTLFKEIYIQTKYCSTAKESVNAAFENGKYRYVSKKYGVMQLEVPKDQYADALKEFEIKIKNCQVIDENGNPVKGRASKYVRQGHYTYKQAVNIAKFGNIDSIMFDIRTGMISCAFAFGISALITIALSYRKNKNLILAIQDGLKVGAKVFGLTMINHVILSQLYRTKLFKNYIGWVPLRNAITISTITLIVYSIPDIMNLLHENISFNQFIKNTLVLGSGIVGGAVGANIGKVIGGATAGPIGSVVGGMAGGAIATNTTKCVLDVFMDDDMVIFSRLFTAILSSMAVDFMLSKKELELLSSYLEEAKPDEIKDLIIRSRKSMYQELIISEYLLEYFKLVFRKRRKFTLPKAKKIVKAIMKI